MPIYKDEIEARVFPENVQEVEERIMVEESRMEERNYWVVADATTGELLGCYSRPHVINETHILQEIQNE